VAPRRERAAPPLRPRAGVEQRSGIHRAGAGRAASAAGRHGVGDASAARAVALPVAKVAMRVAGVVEPLALGFLDAGVAPLAGWASLSASPLASPFFFFF
jgi:hypothetical protein